MMTTGKQFKNVLAAVDDSKLGQMALINAIHQSLEDGAKLSIVSVFERDDLSVFDAMSKEKTNAAYADVERALARYETIAHEAGVKDVQLILAEGEPGHVIVKEVVPQYDIDFVVIGSHSNVGRSAYFGSQSSYVANNAPVSVMIVR